MKAITTEGLKTLALAYATGTPLDAILNAIMDALDIDLEAAYSALELALDLAKADLQK